MFSVDLIFFTVASSKQNFKNSFLRVSESLLIRDKAESRKMYAAKSVLRNKYIESPPNPAIRMRYASNGSRPVSLNHRFVILN